MAQFSIVLRLKTTVPLKAQHNLFQTEHALCVLLYLYWLLKLFKHTLLIVSQAVCMCCFLKVPRKSHHFSYLVKSLPSRLSDVGSPSVYILL